MILWLWSLCYPETSPEETTFICDDGGFWLKSPRENEFKKNPPHQNRDEGGAPGLS